MKLGRLMIAGTGGDCGKTMVTLGLAAAFLRRGVPVAVFKKGPDYIDPAWLTLASGRVARNLDTWMMDRDAVVGSFLRNATSEGINLIEGNRGLHDGEDRHGTHSSGELATLLKTPVLLIVPVTKVTRTVAAIVLGIKLLDPDVEFGGVVLNRVATTRQEAIIRAAVEESTGLPVLGSIPYARESLLPTRHLGLVTPQEHDQGLKAIWSAADLVEKSVDMHRLRGIAEAAVPLPSAETEIVPHLPSSSGLRIGYFRSSAFTFYYPENLEALDRSGAVRVPVDPLSDSSLPEMDGLYIGGGFPETHAGFIAANADFRQSLSAAVNRGLPVWAECGGLIFLCRSLHWKGNRFEMAGVLDADVVLGDRPAGHGYQEVTVDRPNPFIKVGTVLRGHEFHYSRVEPLGLIETAFKVNRGTGLGNGRDGLTVRSVLATYLHVHALGTPDWVHWLLNAASAYRGHKIADR